MSLKAIAVPPSEGKEPVGLIVTLHGWGANAQDLASLVPFLNLPDFQFMFPDAPFPHPYSSTGRQPQEAAYRRGWPDSGSEYIHAVNPGNRPIC